MGGALRFGGFLRRGHRARRIALAGALVIMPLGVAACVPGAPGVPIVTYTITGHCTQVAGEPNPGSTQCVDLFSGTPGGADLTLVNDSGGTEQYTVKFPYTRQISRPPDGFVYLSGQLNGFGSISCTISVGTTIIQQATSNGTFVIATCSGEI